MGAIVFNNAATVLTGAITASSTTVNVSDVREFALPAGTPNWEAASSSPGTTFTIITLESADNSTREVVRLRAVSTGAGNTGTFTISRIAATSSAFSVGDKAELRISAELVTELSQDGATGPTGLGYSSVAYASSTGALTFTGSGGNSDIVTGSVKGDTGANISGVSLTLDNSSAAGNQYDMAFTTSAGATITVNQAILAPTGPAAGVSQVITEGVTGSAPSEDAVFDALALKQDTSTFTSDVRSQISTPTGSLVSYSSSSGEISLAALSLHDTEVYSTKALRNADTSTTWHRGDVAVITTTGANKGSYIYVGTDMTAAGTSADSDWVRLVTPDAAATNLSYDTASRVLSSSTGTNTTIPLSTTSASGLMTATQFNELAAVTDGTFAASSSYADGVKAKFGTGDDLQIFHNSTHSYISEVGTGSLKVGASTFSVENAAHNSTMIEALQSGAVTIYHAGDATMATTSTGVSVTGDLVASDDIVANGGIIEVKTDSGAAGAIRLYCESNNAHYQTVQSQPHAANVSNTMLLPDGANSTLVSLVSSDTLSNKTLASPAITGNLTTNGLIDGREVAEDGDKLDDISENADVTGTALTAFTTFNGAVGGDIVPVYDSSANIWKKSTITNAALAGPAGPAAATYSVSGTVLTITT